MEPAEQFSPQNLVVGGKDALPISTTVIGPPDGYPICLFHGGGQTRHAWRRAQVTLASDGFLAIAADLRGHGDSGWSADRAYDPSDYADDVRALVRTLAKPPILVGASLGGIASILAAGEHPPLPVAGIALVDVAANMQVKGSQAILKFMLATSEGFANLEEAADAVAAYLPHRKRPRDTSGLQKNLRQRPDGRLVWHWDPNAFTRPFDRVGVNHRLEVAATRIAAPAILLRGEESELVTREIAETYMARMDRGTVVDIPQARHMIVGDQNDAFTTELLSFCKNVRAAAVLI